MENERVILATDADAAALVTVQLWKSRNGNLYNDERIARAASATHDICACGTIFSKSTGCMPCREAREWERYLKLPMVKVETIPDGEPLFWARDQLYYDVESFMDDCFNDGAHPAKVECRTVRKVKLKDPPIDEVFDYLQCEDFDIEDLIHPNVVAAFNALVQAINANPETNYYEVDDRRINPEAFSDYERDYLEGDDD